VVFKVKVKRKKMFYKFDNFVNRLGRTSPLLATNPAGLTPQPRELFKEPEFHFESSKVKPVKLEADVRYATHAAHGESASTGHVTGRPLGVVPAAEGYGRIANLQNTWLASGELMVWQKRGMRDAGPFYATMGLCALSVVYGLYLIANMSFPKKPESE